jgi:predicted O-methyltransferase YrrM
MKLLIPFLAVPLAFAQVKESPDLDKRVQEFLDSRRRTWHDMNVPASDGKLLYDIILKNKYKSALEIGTSTGHSAIWMAWALSKTGGKLITVEIDEDRYKTALKNFEDAGLSQYIDARLADAHELVPKLEGPFDFVFSDADKDWYTKYFVAVSPKLVVKGCFTAHNVRESGWGSGGGTGDFLKYIRKQPNYTTTVNSDGAGVSISYKTAPD